MPLENWFVGYKTSQYTGKHDLGPFASSPGTWSGQLVYENAHSPCFDPGIWPFDENAVGA